MNPQGGSIKSLVVQSSAPKKITQIQFGTLGSDEIQKLSEVQVTNSSLFDFPARKAIPYGPMDTKLGISVSD
jgi:DNA-directed RNA polymerase beta' subunit